MSVLNFKDLKLQGKLLKDCELCYQDNYDNLRLYVLKDTYNFNFYAILLSFFECGYVYDLDTWEQPDLKVEKMLEVTAFWDGVRHIDVQDSLSYPDVLKLSEVFKVIADIEDEVCQESLRSELCDLSLT